MVNHIIPKTLLEAIEYINNHKTNKVAGGTDIMVKKRSTSNVPPKFKDDAIYLSNLKELNYIKATKQAIEIGAMTPLSDILLHDDVPKLLKDAIELMASPALRNVATLAGNIGNASPAADSVPVLSLYDADVTLHSEQRIRRVNINDFITGPGNTILKDNELITKITIPIINSTYHSFVKVGGRKADAISKICFAGMIAIDNDKIKDFRISIGSVAPAPIRVNEIEAIVKGMSVNELVQNKQYISSLYNKHISPIDDQRSNKQYRRKITLNIIEDFIEACKEC